MKLIDLIPEQSVKYIEFEVYARNKKIGTFYTDITADQRDISSYAHMMTPPGYKEKNWGSMYIASVMTGTNRPSGKYIKPSLLKKAREQEVKLAKDNMSKRR